MQETSRGIGPTLNERDRRVWDSRESRGARRRSGYIGEAAVDAVLLYVISGPLVWSLLPFLTESFVAPQALMQLSLLASMVANLAFVVFDFGWFRHLAKVGLSVLAFAATYSLLTVFPFAFDNAGIGEVVRICLVIGLFGIAIAAVVELFQFLFGWIKSWAAVTNDGLGQ